MVANMIWKKIHVQEVYHQPVLMYHERKAEAKTEEEGGVNAKKKSIRALRNPPDIWKRKWPLLKLSTPSQKTSRYRWSCSEWS